jgi:hypothetical protein
LEQAINAVEARCGKPFLVFQQMLDQWPFVVGFTSSRWLWGVPPYIFAAPLLNIGGCYKSVLAPDQEDTGQTSEFALYIL